MNNVRLNAKLIKTLDKVLFLPAKYMIEKSAIPCTTWYANKKNPDNITVQQLLLMSNGLHIPVRRFFSTGRSDLIGRRDDYIVDDYIPCHYNAAILQDTVSTKEGATWKKASVATGITYDNLRKSLLAIRRTPVIRFLDSCKALNIDPFSILIDPNPEMKPKGKRGTTETALSEITSMRQQIAELSATVADLTKKYEHLLAVYENLVERINEGMYENNHIGMAAEKGQ